MGLGGGDDGVVVMPQPWRVPWWRSVGFWLGAWVLVFLIWVTVDSFSNLWIVRSRGWVMNRGSSVGEVGWRVALEHGTLAYVRTGVHERTAGTATFMRPLSLHHGGGQGVDTPSPWGTESTMNLLEEEPERLSLKTTRFWFPFVLVVTGYVGVWMGSLAMWRRWMRRRWEATQGDG